MALLAAGCGSGPAEPPAEFPYARATPECGPADGPAVTIMLLGDTMPQLPPGTPRVRVTIWHPLGALAGESWTVGGASRDGFAEYVDGESTTALTGTVTVTDVRADSTVEGEMDLASGGTLAVRGGFSARWVPRALMCG